MYKYLACLYLILVGVEQLQACGSYLASDGTPYNLTALQKPKSVGYRFVDLQANTYLFNLCDTYSSPQTEYCYGTSCAYQILANGACRILGMLPAAITDGVNGPDTGVTMRYTNYEDLCETTGAPKMVQITIKCDHNNEAVQSVSQPDSCVFDIIMSSPHACPTTTKKTSPVEGLSGGSIFLIIFFVVAVVYFVGGAFFRYKFQEVEVGVNLVPNLGFWSEIPGLVKDGCVFTYEKIRGRFAGDL